MGMGLESSWVRIQFVFACSATVPYHVCRGRKEPVVSGLTLKGRPSPFHPNFGSIHFPLILLPVQNGNRQILGAWGAGGLGK